MASRVGTSGAGDVTSGTTDGSASPIERLKRRYIDGETDDDEFERRLERLVAVEGTDERPADDAVRRRDRRPSHRKNTTPIRER